MFTSKRFATFGLVAAVLAGLIGIDSSTSARAQQDAGTLRQEDAAYDAPDYSPFVDRHVPDRVFWGDTHLHTSYSVDAGFFGNTLDPEDAYRFARGEEVVSSSGQRIKLIRPLDWLVVADHAEYFGLADLLASGDPSVLENPVTARWYKMRRGTQEEGAEAFYEVVDSITRNDNLVDDPSIQRTAWDKTLGFAQAYNDPGVFSNHHGFRMDVLTQRQQPASGGHVPRRRRSRAAGRAFLGLQLRRSGGPVGLVAGL